MSKIINFRVNESELEKLTAQAGGLPLSTYIKRKALDLVKVEGLSEDRYKLAVLFTNDFMENVMVNSRTIKSQDFVKMAKYLSDAVNRAGMVSPEGNVVVDDRLAQFAKAVNAIQFIHSEIGIDQDGKRVYPIMIGSTEFKIAPGDYRYNLVDEKYRKEFEGKASY